MPRILVIEDEAPIRDEVLDWLTFEGYDVIFAANGKLGLKAIQEQTPDLILCDIAMPELDGLQVLTAVRSDAAISAIPFIFLTASADRVSIRKGLDMGADDYITKPFTHAAVLNAVTAHLKKISG